MSSRPYYSTGSRPVPHAVAGPASNGGNWVCWLLMLMGLATFTPCILLPEWREYQALRLVEQRERHRLEQLERVLERERRALEAIQTDPAVVARLAKRDLRYHDPAEATVSVAAPRAGPVPAEEFVAEPIDPPSWLATGGQYLPRLNYDGVFCDEGTRRIVMGMSVGLILISLVLSPSRRAATD